jgi:hypothetical protein
LVVGALSLVELVVAGAAAEAAAAGEESDCAKAGSAIALARIDAVSIKAVRFITIAPSLPAKLPLIPS